MVRYDVATRNLLVMRRFVVSGDRGRGVDVSRRTAQAWSEHDGISDRGCGAGVSTIAPRKDVSHAMQAFSRR